MGVSSASIDPALSCQKDKGRTSPNQRPGIGRHHTLASEKGHHTQDVRSPGQGCNNIHGPFTGGWKTQRSPGGNIPGSSGLEAAQQHTRYTSTETSFKVRKYPKAFPDL